jgi:hypothetical protein
MKSIKVKRARQQVNKSPRDIIGPKNVKALRRAGFVVVPLSELRQFRAKIKSILDILSNEPNRKG